MFPISLPCPSNTIRGQAGQCGWHILYVQMHSPSPHSTSVVLSCFLVPPPGSFPHFLSNLMPLAPATFFLLTLHRNTSHHTSNYKVNFTFYFSFFLPPPLLPQKLKFTAMYNHSMNFFTSSQFPFLAS